ncbi:arabinofuranosidase catalytic domain-containing protein [Aestuariivirga sp.]|uniref:arabinofuranosidase catalytic domain-containing protein n=1 Tax=Aestuariivirga sp. TaxID=2650926 RepID=UPI003BA842B8
MTFPGNPIPGANLLSDGDVSSVGGIFSNSLKLLGSLRQLPWLLAALGLMAVHASAASLSFTVTANEPVTVTGTPRIAIDVGGTARYAAFAAGSGTSALTFSYAVQAGDFDADGIDVGTQLDLNGATITDAAGNPMAALSFTKPETSALKVQTYTAAYTSTANPAAVSFTISKAPINAAFNYTISSNGGSETVTGSGTIAASPQAVSGVDVSGLAAGTLTLSVTVTNATGTGAARTAAFTPSFVGALDTAPATSSSYSVRRLRAAYTGPLLRVRRSTDNAEQDIGATVAGDLNATALTSFCGAASCYVRSWYDQSGNARDATQPAAASQPRIVNAGVIEKVNSRPAIKGDGVDDQMLFSLGPLVSYPVSINIVLAKTSASERGAWVKLGGLAANSGGIALGVGSSANFYTFGQNIVGLKETVVWMPTSTVLASSAVITYTQGAGTNSTAMFQNGSTVSGTNFSNAPLVPNGTTGYLFGHTLFNSEQRWSANPISEAVLAPSAFSTSERQALERGQGTYYGITVQ